MLFLLQAFLSGGIINGKRGYHHRNLHRKIPRLDKIWRAIAECGQHISKEKAVE
jgi:hypothetical protein